MAIDFSLFDKKIPIDSIDLQLENGQSKVIDILRLDKIHPTISGNKWFKLKYNLLEAERMNADSILSFGGAFSNHLHALAYAGKLFNIKTIGIVRGEKVQNPTLTDCKNWGMELHFIPRSEYRKKTDPAFLQQLKAKFRNPYIIPEGGDNELGQKGCAEILSTEMIANYDVLSSSVGTGTTIKGLAQFFKNRILAIAPLKNEHDLKQDLQTNIPNLQYFDGYHFGGFGKVTATLLNFQSHFLMHHGIELDKIYTAKMFFGLQQELKKNIAFSDKKILAIHTGGLQGNRPML